MVGRERQLAQLGQSFDSGCGGLVLSAVHGARRRRASGNPVWWRSSSPSLGRPRGVLRGRCLPYGEGITYYPVVAAIKQAAGLDRTSTFPTSSRRRCAPSSRARNIRIRSAGTSRRLIGDRRHPRAVEETFWADPPLLRSSRARDRPLVLVFDDIHWGEPTFLDLVEHIADWSRGVIDPACFAWRALDLLEARPGWGGGKLNAVSVSLEPLTYERDAERASHESPRVG